MLNLRNQKVCRQVIKAFLFFQGIMMLLASFAVGFYSIWWHPYTLDGFVFLFYPISYYAGEIGLELLGTYLTVTWPLYGIISTAAIGTWLVIRFSRLKDRKLTLFILWGLIYFFYMGFLRQNDYVMLIQSFNFQKLSDILLIYLLAMLLPISGNIFNRHELMNDVVGFEILSILFLLFSAMMFFQGPNSLPVGMILRDLFFILMMPLVVILIVCSFLLFMNFLKSFYSEVVGDIG